jgi:hypothetical protein
MRNQHHNLYKPGFAEDQIPVPLPWLDSLAPWLIIAMGAVMLGCSFVRWV